MIACSLCLRMLHSPNSSEFVDVIRIILIIRYHATCKFISSTAISFTIIPSASAIRRRLNFQQGIVTHRLVLYALEAWKILAESCNNSVLFTPSLFSDLNHISLRFVSTSLLLSVSNQII